MPSERLTGSFFNKTQLHYLLYYVPPSKGPCKYQSQIIAFKNGTRSELSRFIPLIINEVIEKELGKFIDDNTLIIRALSSKELSIPDTLSTPLDLLANKIVRNVGGTYIPSILAKKRRSNPIKQMSKAQRQTELKDIYLITDKGKNFTPKKILILDDISTSGTTLCEIVETVKKFYKIDYSNIKTLCLAKTSYEVGINDKLTY